MSVSCRAMNCCNTVALSGHAFAAWTIGFEMPTSTLTQPFGQRCQHFAHIICRTQLASNTEGDHHCRPRRSPDDSEHHSSEMNCDSSRITMSCESLASCVRRVVIIRQLMWHRRKMTRAQHESPEKSPVCRGSGRRVVRESCRAEENGSSSRALRIASSESSSEVKRHRTMECHHQG
jgi:hypothetical protein